MRICILLFTGCILFMQCKNEIKKEINVEQFNWLSGNWSMQDDEGTTTEEWRIINDSLMEGKSDFVKGDSVIPFETIRLFYSNNSFYYEAKAAGQNEEQPVAFKLSSYSDSGFVAENPEHDFPKRITYKLINTDSIHAFIDGGTAMPEKKIDFNYSRIKN